MCIGMANGGKIMTPQKALNRLDETVTGNLEWKIVLSNALEKQIPKKVEIEVFEDIDEDTGKPYTMMFKKCSACGEHIGLKAHRFCAYCGQALDWSDTE
jgi:hypothetical protein